ncbi:MAG: PHP-associated domain-containing protein [Gemmatimonadota bacterium]
MTERWRLDLHVHTRYSYDCLSPVEEVLRVARERGLDKVAITDHNEIEGAFAARALDPGRVIVGEEVRTAEGFDLIGLFLNEKIPAHTPAREAARAIREQGGVVYVPHPFAAGKGGGGAFLDALLPWIDVVEVFNARLHRAGLNRRAQRWAVEHGRPGGAGSDAHSHTEIGRASVDVPPFEGRDGLLAALAQGRVCGASSSPHVHLYSTWAKVWKAVRPDSAPAGAGPGRGAPGPGSGTPR